MDKQTFINATGCLAADKYYDSIINALALENINESNYVAAWLAQFGNESASFSTVSENMNYSINGLLSTWPSRFALDDHPGRVNAVDYARNPQRIGNLVYANRMGNGDEASGDGYRYRGRGFAMVTGKDYYKKCGDGINVDLITHPELLEQPKYAALSAVWVWKDKNCSQYVDHDDFKGLTKAINGGYIGLDDRQQRWVKAKKVLGVS